MFNIKTASRGCTRYPKYVTYAQRHARNFHPMLQRALPTEQHLNDNNFSSRSRLYSQTHTLFKPAVQANDLNLSKNNKNYRTETPMDNSLVGLTGGQIFHEMMIRNNVDTVFGYPGGAILPVYDAIHESKAFNFILPKHEQGAGHMAEGYARASGKPGVVLVTSGPGATNVVTPLADALSDGIPLVVFTGQVATSAIGSDAFQEADVLGITRPCTKWNVMVRNIEELPQRINEAFKIATSGRPGPVLVDLPKDVTAGVLRQLKTDVKPLIPELQVSNTIKSLEEEYTVERIQKAAELINSAKKPVFFVGGGILNNVDGPRILKELSDRANIPVMTTLQGLGSFNQEDPKSLDMVGMHGSAVANLAMQNADLVIAVGARFDDRVTGNLQKFAPAAREASLAGTGGIIQFDINPKNINKVVQTDVAIEGDAADNLKILLPMVFPLKNRTEWFKEINAWKQKYPYDYMKETKDSKIKPQTVISRLSKIANSTGREVIVTTGVGQHQMWTAQHWTWKNPRTFITSGGLGTMGYGLPSAIGAQVAKPQALVIDIDGDASFNMTLNELSSAVQAGVPIKILLLNNEEQGMVTQWQSLFYQNRYSHTHQLNPNFIKLAQAMGLKAVHVNKLDNLNKALEEFVSTPGPVLLEVEVEKKVPVLPMVPAGKGLDEFISFNPEIEKEQNRVRHERTNGEF